LTPRAGKAVYVFRVFWFFATLTFFCQCRHQWDNNSSRAETPPCTSLCVLSRTWNKCGARILFKCRNCCLTSLLILKNGFIVYFCSSRRIPRFAQSSAFCPREYYIKFKFKFQLSTVAASVCAMLFTLYFSDIDYCKLLLICSCILYCIPVSRQCLCALVMVHNIY
jgi:hypothetical protein